MKSTESAIGGCMIIKESEEKNTLSLAHIRSYTCYVFESLDSWLFQLFDLLLDHKLKGLVVDEAWQFSSTIPLFILLHLFLNPLIN